MNYRSAKDLPSFVEISRQISALRILRHLAPAGEKPDVRALRKQLDHMADTVDAFYALLGPRNWIFHESISLEFAAELVATTTDPGTAESKLIAYYNDHERLVLLTAGLRRLPAMRRRLDLVQKAASDYFAGRYYACIHVLLSVMDGFVNEFETVRRGLHARQAEELKAWDSVVGHHMGLANAHRTFTKGRSATDEEPVYELYRNGIVHGSLLNYDNIVVATKAWNRLMAVADWAQAREKEQQPVPEKPTVRGLVTTLTQNQRVRKAVQGFQPFELIPGEGEFATHPVSVASESFLTAWSRRNFGGMASLVTAELHRKHGNAVPREVRLAYADHPLCAFKVQRISVAAAAACTVRVEITGADGNSRFISLRWIREDESGDPVPVPLDGGVWRLYTWDPARFVRVEDGDVHGIG